MAYNTGFGSANELLGGSRFVELAPAPMAKQSHEVDTAQPRIPDLLASSRALSFELAPSLDVSALLAKPERERAFPKLELFDPDRMYVPKGRIKRLGDLGLLDFDEK